MSESAPNTKFSFATIILMLGGLVVLPAWEDGPWWAVGALYLFGSAIILRAAFVLRYAGADGVFQDAEVEAIRATKAWQRSSAYRTVVRAFVESSHADEVDVWARNVLSTMDPEEFADELRETLRRVGGSGREAP